MSARLISSATILLVKDVDVSAKWYEDKCGFKIENFYGEPHSFAIISRDDYYLMFAKCDPDKIVPNWKNVSATSNAYFWTDNVEDLYKEFVESDTTIDYELCIQPYGVKEFGINDPDGYDISFGQILKEF